MVEKIFNIHTRDAWIKKYIFSELLKAIIAGPPAFMGTSTTMPQASARWKKATLGICSSISPHSPSPFTTDLSLSLTTFITVLLFPHLLSILYIITKNQNLFGN